MRLAERLVHIAAGVVTPNRLEIFELKQYREPPRYDLDAGCGLEVQTAPSSRGTAVRMGRADRTAQATPHHGTRTSLSDDVSQVQARERR